MRVAFVNAPWKEGYNRCGRWGGRTVSQSVNPPVYALYAAAIVEQQGHNAMVIDAAAEGASIDDVVARVTGFYTDLAVIETNCASVEADLACAKAVRETGATIALSGLMATVAPQKLLEQNPYVDLCFIGEYDYAPVAVLDAEWPVIDGIAYRMGSGKIYVRPKTTYICDLDALPYPAYHLVRPELYDEIIIQNRPFVQSVESRSCPFRCTFCVSHSMYGTQWRAMSPTRIVDEMEHWEHKSIKEVFWDGETFTVNKARCKAICDLIRERGLSIQWSCLSRADTVTEAMLRDMADAGCCQIRYGFESADQGVLDFVGKGYEVHRIQEAARWTRDAGILVHGAWMFVPPVETEGSAQATIDLATQTCDTAQFTICTPYPGTTFYEQCRREGWLLTEDWSTYLASDRSVVKTDLNLREWVKRGYRGFYGRPSYIARAAIREIRKGTLRKAMRVGATILRGDFW